MLSFFKHLTFKKIVGILFGGIIIFFSLIRGSFGYQQFTNSEWFLQRTFSNIHTTNSSIHLGRDIRLQIVGDRSKESLLIIGGAGSGIFNWRHLVKEEGLLEKYYIILVNQSFTDIKDTDSFVELVGTYIAELKHSKPLTILSKGGGTYSTLALLDRYESYIDKAIMISGYYNTLIDTTTSTEQKYMEKLGFLLSPNFKKAWSQKRESEESLNSLLQKLSGTLKTPLLILHGKYDLHLGSGHAVYLKEVLRKDTVEVALTDTKQLCLEDHSNLLVKYIDSF